MTKTKLKPCPFCGGEAFLTKNVKSGVFYVFCKECLRNGRGDIISQKAAEKWNTRPIEDALQDEVKRLREALKGGEYYEAELWTDVREIREDEYEIEREK